MKFIIIIGVLLMLIIIAIIIVGVINNKNNNNNNNNGGKTTYTYDISKNVGISGFDVTTNIPTSPGDINSLKNACNQTSNCAGFLSSGHLKSNVNQNNRNTNPGTDLYIKMK